MKKILYMIIVSMLTMGCVSHYGAFGNGKYDFSCYLQVNQDSTFLLETHRHWWQWNSFGAWAPVPDKKDHFILKSSQEDYTIVPINVVESRSENPKRRLIFPQSAKHYDCERKEIYVNGQTYTIDKDTIELLCDRVDSIMICLGYNNRNNIMFFSPHYDSICSQIYYPIDSANNIFSITLPEYPYNKDGGSQNLKASMLFLYVPIMDTEACYRYGKWYLYDKNGKMIAYKKLKRTPRRKK